MQSTLKHNDPHDAVEITPDVALVARAEEELSRLAKRRPPELQPQMRLDLQPQMRLNFESLMRTATEADVSAASAAPAAVPPVDTTFRATDVNGSLRRNRSSIGRRLARAFIGFVLAIGIGAAGFAWRHHGGAVKQTLAQWMPGFGSFLSLTSESAASQQAASQSTDQAAAAEPTPQPPAPEQTAAAATDSAAPAVVAQAAPPAAAPAAEQPAAVQSAAAAPAQDSGQLDQMARDLANARQEIDELKASIATLKAGQEQLTHDVAKATERPKVTPPPRPVTAIPVRRPPSVRPTQSAAAAPYTPPATAPYVPPPPAAGPYVQPPAPSSYASRPYPAQQYPAQAAPPPPVSDDPELASVPRPPMPVR